LKKDGLKGALVYYGESTPLLYGT